MLLCVRKAITEYSQLILIVNTLKTDKKMLWKRYDIIAVNE